MAPKLEEVAATVFAATAIVNDDVGWCGKLQEGASNPFWALT